MKTKISRRFLSLFAAVLVAFSLISTVALAAEIQPRIQSCPECGTGSTHYAYEWYNTWQKCGSHNNDSSRAHYRAYYYRNLVCERCNVVEQTVIAQGYYCPFGCGGFVKE